MGPKFTTHQHHAEGQHKLAWFYALFFSQGLKIRF